MGRSADGFRRLSNCSTEILTSRLFPRCCRHSNCPSAPMTGVIIFGATAAAARIFKNDTTPASVGEVVFSAEDLGIFTLRCEREPIPLRWVFKRGNTLRLIDDSGGSVAPQVSRYSFEAPDHPEVSPVMVQDVLRGVSTESAGGMYVAATQGLSRAIIVPPHGRLSFADLKAQPKVDLARGHSAAQVLTLLNVIKLWATARVTGNPLSSSRRREVLRRLCRHVFFLLAGDTWD